MNYYSTNKKAPSVSLREAVLNGLAQDGGLYMPERISQMPSDFFVRLPSLSFQEIAYEVGRVLFAGDLPDSTLDEICRESFDFPVPLKRVDASTHALELFHGPTLAFKDFAARFMARLMGYYVRHDDRELTILVATSGDTGSAAAHGFLNVPGIRVFILYPSGRVSDLQEKQLTTMGGNITALEVQGSFDDCQALAKQAFVDPDLKKKMRMGSANSINIARLFPQTFYYWWAVEQMGKRGQAQILHSQKLSQTPTEPDPIIVSVPSGNVGNLTAGLIAKQMGLPIGRFIAACNENNVIPEYLKTGIFTPKPSRATISNAMDVGNPSNFVRMQELYGHSADAMRHDLSAHSFTDDQTRAAMRDVYNDTGYILDPHGAVGYCALKEYQKQYPETYGIILETAHPAKFKDVVEDTIGSPVDIPKRLAEYMMREKQAVLLPARFGALKEFLISS
ncbi:threonine synthase [Candidatus Uhrbacteria bacterium]|nr:threonine synthase [Candidatus Uhrbacteria bacterium]